jgi:ATPase subunit of ABC transporter with duplicated ATPase domains
LPFSGRPGAPDTTAMIALANLTKHYGQKTLFQDVSLTLSPGRCYGLVGANGSGKSTLLRIIAGEETPSSGNVGMPKRARLGLLRQDHFLSDTQPIIEVAMMGDRDVFDAIMEKERLLADESGDFDGDRFHALEETISSRDGYSLESRAGAILEGLGIPTAFHRQPLSTLSGGFKLRVLMAQALASQPDILLLDEPTNHLDIISIRWLEKFLNTFAGLSMVVSHDHRFLDNACTDILDVDYEVVQHYPGNYTYFQEAKVEDRERKEAEIEKKQKEIEHHQAYIDRFRYKATKARQAQSKMKLLERVVIDPLAKSSRAHPTFKFTQRRPSGREVAKVEKVSKSYGPKRVLDGVSLTVMRGDRLAVIGPNGIGKSTLLKIMMGELPPDSGTSAWGYETHPGYFAQDQRFTKATPQATAQSWLWDSCPGEPIGYVRGQLGLVLFSGDDAEKRIASLSGGEAARLTFARLSVEKPNVLVLDEPTNHLDLEAIESLVEGLSAYDGTVIFVSHDRWFVSQLATRILEITPQGVNDFPGTYEEYLAKAGDDHLDASAAMARAKQQKDAALVAAAAAAAPAAKGADAGKGAAPAPQDEKARARRKAELGKKSEQVSSDLAKAEARVKEIDKVYCAPRFFETTPRDEVRRLDLERESLRRKVDELMAEWERLEKELAKA